jgi:hypothetical protein
MRVLISSEASHVSGGGIDGARKTITRHRYDKVHTLQDGFDLYRDIMTGKYWVGTPADPRQCWIRGEENVQKLKLGGDLAEFCPNLPG